MNDALWTLPAAELAQRIRQREVSCREAMQSCLERLEAINPHINAVVDWCAEAALTEADKADAHIASGQPLGPLHGVPITIKINVDQAGWASSNGIASRRDVIASEDCPVVANLRKAGATILGRTNTPAFSLRWFTDNDAYGRTLNPHNSALTPGGSSGGAAAAVASGLGAIAHGNDQGGSIRYPAYACGVYGLRPSFQRIAAFNVTMPSRSLLFEMTSVQGPLARNVADLRLAWETMSIADARDPWQVPIPLQNHPLSPPVRVALCKHIPGFACDPEVGQALMQAANWLEEAGYQVEETSLPHFAECAQLWFTFTVTDVRAKLQDALLREGDAAVQNSFAMMARRVPEILDLSGYLDMLAQRTTLRRAWSLFLQDYPLVLMPVSWRKPFAIDGDQVSPDSTAADDLLNAQSPLVATAALGLPALAAPIFSAVDTPCGVQLVGAPFREDLCLAAAEVLERQTGVLRPVDPIC